MSYERANIRRMTGYTPGEQPQSQDVVKLNTNENPYPPCAGVLEAYRSFDPARLRRYPQPMARDFCRVAGSVHGVSPSQIVATNAGDELLRLMITTFVEVGGAIGTAVPSYSLYPVLAAIHGARVVSVPLQADWSLPDDFAKQMNDAGVQLTFVVNPHAPTGVLRSVDALDALASALDGVLLIDEAYVDFVDPALGHDTIGLVNRHENVMLLRTLSKGYSLAGLRFGYGIGSCDLVAPIAGKTKDSYNTDAIAQHLATAALLHRDQASVTWSAVRRERDRMVAALNDLGLATGASQTNFVLARMPDAGPEAQSVYESLKGRGVIVRYFDQDRLREKLRITIGTEQENEVLLNNLREVLHGS